MPDITLPSRPSDKLLAGMSQQPGLPTPSSQAEMPPADSSSGQPTPIGPSSPIGGSFPQPSTPTDASPAAAPPSEAAPEMGDDLHQVLKSKEMRDIKALFVELKKDIEEIKNTEAPKMPEIPEVDLKPILDAIKGLSDRISSLEGKESPKQDSYDDSALMKEVKRLNAKMVVLSQIVLDSAKVAPAPQKEPSEPVQAVRDSKGKIIKVIRKEGNSVQEKDIKRDENGDIIK